MSDPNETIELSREAEPAGEAVPAEASTDSGADLAAMRLSSAGLLERRRTAQTVHVFDLREVEAFQESHLPGAYSLPFEFVESNLHRLPFSGEILFYDGGEGLAQQAAALLHDNGFTDQYYVEEGAEALLEALRDSPDEVKFGELAEGERKSAIEAALDERVREFLARDGGGLEVIGIEDNRVLVSYQGACGGCASSSSGTLMVIQSALTIALNHDIEVVPV